MALRSLEAATSCMALVICIVDSMLRIRSLTAFIFEAAMRIPPKLPLLCLQENPLIVLQSGPEVRLSLIA